MTTSHAWPRSSLTRFSMYSGIILSETQRPHPATLILYSVPRVNIAILYIPVSLALNPYLTSFVSNFAQNSAVSLMTPRFLPVHLTGTGLTSGGRGQSRGQLSYDSSSSQTTFPQYCSTQFPSKHKPLSQPQSSQQLALVSCVLHSPSPQTSVLTSTDMSSSPLLSQSSSAPWAMPSHLKMHVSSESCCKLWQMISSLESTMLIL